MDLQSQIALIIASQVFTIAALIVTNYMNLRHSRRILEVELQVHKRAEHLQEQLTKFYGPIYTLLSVNAVILKTSYDPITKSFTNMIPDELWDDLRDNIIIPNNLAIVGIIKDKFHLIADPDIPPSVLSFIVHAEVFARRHKHKLAKAEYFKNFAFPIEFEDYISKTTEKVKREYDTLVARTNTKKNNLRVY